MQASMLLHLSLRQSPWTPLLPGGEAVVETKIKVGGAMVKAEEAIVKAGEATVKTEEVPHRDTLASLLQLGGLGL